MKIRALLSAIALCFTAAACDSQKAAEPPKPKTAAVVPLPPAAPTAPAASANQDATPAQAADTKAGTPPPPKARPKKGCAGHNCKVELTVGANCAITAVPDALPVFAKGVDIKWSVKPAGWKFAANGIEFKKTGQSQFSGQAGGNSNNYKWTDANTDQDDYKYIIHVVNGTQHCDVDPSIVNGAEMEGDPPY